MYRLLAVHIVASFTYSGLCFYVLCVLEVLCLIVVRGLLEVFGDLDPPPVPPTSSERKFIPSQNQPTWSERKTLFKTRNISHV